MVTILIADDHAIVRDGLKQILASTGDLLVGGEARDGHDVMRLVRERGMEAFPITAIKGRVIKVGAYPTREEIYKALGGVQEAERATR